MFISSCLSTPFTAARAKKSTLKIRYYYLFDAEMQDAPRESKHFQNREGIQTVWQVEEEAIRRRAGTESKLYWQVGERAEE
jgi:hypothetical protein